MITPFPLRQEKTFHMVEDRKSQVDASVTSQVWQWPFQMFEYSFIEGLDKLSHLTRSCSFAVCSQSFLLTVISWYMWSGVNKKHSPLNWIQNAKLVASPAASFKFVYTESIYSQLTSFRWACLFVSVSLCCCSSCGISGLINLLGRWSCIWHSKSEREFSHQPSFSKFICKKIASGVSHKCSSMHQRTFHQLVPWSQWNKMNTVKSKQETFSLDFNKAECGNALIKQTFFSFDQVSFCRACQHSPLIHALRQRIWKEIKV